MLQLKAVLVLDDNLLDGKKGVKDHGLDVEEQLFRALFPDLTQKVPGVVVFFKFCLEISPKYLTNVWSLKPTNLMIQPHEQKS